MVGSVPLRMRAPGGFDEIIICLGEALEVLEKLDAQGGQVVGRARHISLVSKPFQPMPT